jgi:ubiquinone/menaquinone biosynthesis C-methylase UbiE
MRRCGSVAAGHGPSSGKTARAPIVISRSPRVNYDEIAHLYDSQPHRARAADLELLTFARERAGPDLAVLDIGCGTGNQLIADLGALPNIRYTGLDRSFGMLREARRKASDIAWVQADGAALPFAARSFDFVCSQFAFHHIKDRVGMLHAVFRVLRPGGRFVLRNLCPQESGGWLYYEYFPEAQLVDLRDFWAPGRVIGTMQAAGFVGVTAAYEHLRFEQNLPAWLEIVRRRDTCSQLQAISDAAYQAGVTRLERDIADPSRPRSCQDHLCLVAICGEAAR